jgi:DNA-binding NarL/FixJ family response regulator
MSRKRAHREKNFSPLRDKTLTNVLRQMFVTEFGYENKVIFAEAMIERILETINAFVKPISMLKPGQMLWMAVLDDGRKHARQSMREIPQVPIILDLVTDDDLQSLADGADFITVRRRRHARLLDQAYAQGGTLAHTDLSAITLTSERVTGSDVQHIQQAEDRLLPHRGLVHDLGPTLSHKVEVVRLLEAGYLEPEIARKLSPVHSLRSVERYAQIYRNVLKLLKRGFTPSEIAGILDISQRLVETYVEIVNEHHPQVITEHPYLNKSVDALDQMTHT